MNRKTLKLLFVFNSIVVIMFVIATAIAEGMNGLGILLVTTIIGEIAMIVAVLTDK